MLKNCINIAALMVFLCTHSLGQVNEKDTVQWLIFNKNPNAIVQLDNESQINPVRRITLKVSELKPVSNSSTSVKFVDQLNNKEIIILRTVFQSDKHTYNFEKNLIDGKTAFGHDGFASKAYVDSNFRSELAEIRIIDNISKNEINFVNSNFPVCIHPLLTFHNGECAVKAFSIEKYFKYLIIITGGGGGAGSYENYFLIDLYERIWIFARDITTGTVYFVPISNQKDPFLKNAKTNWYDIILK